MRERRRDRTPTAGQLTPTYTLLDAFRSDRLLLANLLTMSSRSQRTVGDHKRPVWPGKRYPAHVRRRRQSTSAQLIVRPTIALRGGLGKPRRPSDPVAGSDVIGDQAGGPSPVIPQHMIGVCALLDDGWHVTDDRRCAHWSDHSDTGVLACRARQWACRHNRPVKSSHDGQARGNGRHIVLDSGAVH